MNYYTVGNADFCFKYLFLILVHLQSVRIHHDEIKNLKGTLDEIELINYRKKM